MPNDMKPVRNGFTMVELMVVLLLIGLSATAVVMTVGAASRNAGNQAEQFAMRVAALRDRAVVESRPLAFWVRPSGYGFESRDGQIWSPIDRKPFVTTDWQSPFVAKLESGRMVRVAFDANGIPTAPVELMLASGSDQMRVKLDAAGNVNVSR